MALDWLVPLLSAIAACVAFFLSKPERPRLALLAVMFVVIAGAWEASKQFSEGKAKRAVQAVTYRRLIGETDLLLDFVSEMVFRASAGWLPESEEDFFSPRTAQLMCRELDISRSAPVIPEQSWRSRTSEVFSGYQTVLREVINQQALVLDAGLIRAIDKVARSHFLETGRLAILTHRVDVDKGISRAPLLCWGLEPLVEDSLRDLDRLYRLLKAKEKDAGVSPIREWLLFPLPHQQHLLGESRFGPSALSEWRASHPNSPGPMKFGRGNPNKGISRTP